MIYQLKNLKFLILVKKNYNDKQDDNFKLMNIGKCISRKLYNTDTNKLVCIPPVKAKELTKEEFDNYY